MAAVNLSNSGMSAESIVSGVLKSALQGKHQDAGYFALGRLHDEVKDSGAERFASALEHAITKSQSYYATDDEVMSHGEHPASPNPTIQV